MPGGMPARGGRGPLRRGSHGAEAAARRRRLAAGAVAGCLAASWLVAAGPLGSTALAAAAAPVTAATRTPDAGGLSLVLCIDTSGSMKASDPDGRRAATLRAVAERLGAGDRLGVVGFAAAPTVLMPLQRMGGPAGRLAAARAATALGATGGTDLLSALRAGVAALAADRRAQDRHVLVLLTDGVPDVPGLSDPARAAGYRRAMDAVATAIGRRGWTLDAVGLGAGVDAAGLARLAALGGGRYYPAADAGRLEARLLSLVGRLEIARRAAAVVVRLRVRAAGVRGMPRRGGRVQLLLATTNPSGLPIRLRVSSAVLPAGWTVTPTTVTAAPGAVRSILTLVVGAAPPRGVVARVALRLSPPPGGSPPVALVPGPVARWSVAVPPTLAARLRLYGRPAAGGAAAAAGVLLALGWAGYLLRVRPALGACALVTVEDAHGVPLERLRLPARARVVVGQRDCRRADVRLRWLPGDQAVFCLCAEGDVGGGRWWRGLRAWRRPPEVLRHAEAAWPFHLYRGPVPQLRVELYAGSSFGAAGLTFRLEGALPHRGEPAGTDLLRGLEEGAAEVDAGSSVAPPRQDLAGQAATRRRAAAGGEAP